MNETERIRQAVQILPNANQRRLQDMKFYAFLHYGMNTFTGREWGDGTEPEARFNPKSQDTDQWCRVLKSAGMKGVILTAKHHDGFCLWQTETTPHSVKNSPYKNGKGDVVAELAASCRKYGLKMGVYLSPWDRNAPSYGTPEYNDFYIRQETELLSNYGELFMLWLDGACGADADGKSVQAYDFPRIYETAYRLQPNICISVMGPDVRWVGNESGKCRESEWNVVPFELCEPEAVAQDSQQTENLTEFQAEKLDAVSRDLGSRAVLERFTRFRWYPAEVDVSIRRGWFYHASENRTGLKSLSHLMDIYYKAVGGNSLLLLNIPPDKDGRIHLTDERRLTEMGEWLKKEASLETDAQTKSTEVTERGTEYTFTFPKGSIDRVRFEEDTAFSQRIERFSLYAVKDAREVLLGEGTTVGFGKILLFPPTVTDTLRLVVTESRFEPHLRFFKVTRTGAFRPRKRNT